MKIPMNYRYALYFAVSECGQIIKIGSTTRPTRQLRAIRAYRKALAAAKAANPSR